VRAVDVLAEMEDGSIKSIGGGREYYLLMERAEGTDYFEDLRSFTDKSCLDEQDRAKIRAMVSYLAGIHAVKKISRQLYWRKIRDTVGHGECLMGVFDTYPDGTLRYEEMAEIEKLCIDWRARLKRKTDRLCMIHGDFHPGNIWFRNGGDFTLLDRSRGPWGDAADDVTALTINYIFFSLRYFGDVRGPFIEGLRLFFDDYVSMTGDEEILAVVAPFFAFRGVVVANPVFYPDLSPDVRRKLFTFVRKVLLADRFDVGRVNEYLIP
jgi:aminoglycoside phosphotransferase (APT) family kinase protein